MKKANIQKSLAMLLMTILVAVTISGFVSATDSACENSVDCLSDLQNNEITRDTNCDDPVKVDRDRRDRHREDRDNRDGNNRDSDNNYRDRDDRDNKKDCKDRDNDRYCGDRKDRNSEIGDLVWDDLNANGIQDPDEPGIAGVTVNLWTGNQFKPTTKIATTVTNTTGNYIFTNLRSGIYWLEFIAPNSVVKWIFSPQNQGTNDSIDSDANAAGIAGPTYLKRCESDLSWDAGLYRLAALGDRVWLDVNKNGLQDPTEPGVAGVTVNLWTGNLTGPLVKTAYSTVTNANGNYIFTNLVPGIYWLEFILPSSDIGFFTLQNQGLNDSIDSDVNASGFAGPIELISGEVDLTWDAGIDPGNGAAGGDEEPANGAAGEEIVVIEEPFEEVAAAGEETIPLQKTGLPILPGVLAALIIGGGILERKLRK